MSRHDTPPTISDIGLERYRLGELEPAERRAIEERLVGDEALRARLSSLEQSNREIVERYPAREMAQALRRRQAAEGRSAEAGRQGEGRPAWRGWLVPAVATAACACLVVVARRSGLGSPHSRTRRSRAAPGRWSSTGAWASAARS